MAKTEIKFIDCQLDTDFIKVENKIEQNKNIYIALEGISYGEEFFINLDLSTAIKFSKTLRTEINKAKEAQNG